VLETRGRDSHPASYPNRLAQETNLKNPKPKRGRSILSYSSVWYRQ